MSEITVSQDTELEDPKIKAVADRVVKTFKLAFEKAIANQVDSSKYPLDSSPNSIEKICLLRFNKLAKENQQLAKSRVMLKVNASSQIRDRFYGELNKVKFNLSTPIETQVKTMPFPSSLKLPPNYLNTINNLHGQIFHFEEGMIPQETLDHLELRIHKVKCLDDTGEWFDDEIYLSGTTVDETGDVKRVGAFKVGDFESGDAKTYTPPKSIARFSLNEGSAWPKSYFVAVVLTEKDNGGLADFMNKLYDKVREEVRAAIIKAGGTYGPLGAIVGAAVAYVVNRIIEWFISLWNDEIFPPVTISANIGSLNHRFRTGRTDSQQYWIKWWGYGGTYKLWYDWRVV